MLRVGGYLFKRAETDEEFRQIHCLNYRTFVAEIPQHPDPGTGQLVDKFHDRNIYFIAVRDGQVLGMVSVHAEPPFSVADRLADPSILSTPGTKPLEARLLALEPEKRVSNLFFGLIWVLYDYAQRESFTHLFISGFTERVELYERLGFRALGPAVPCGKAAFVPMVLTVGALPEKLEHIKRLYEMHVEMTPEYGSALNGAAEVASEVCLLPGPVSIAPAVREAFHRPAIYHRGPEFLALFQKVRRDLGDLVGGRDVALFNGSGTLANEAIAANLAADRRSGRGVLLVNGEFGQRLAKQAARFGLNPRVLNWPWGQPWNLEQVAEALRDEPEGSWVWGVHQESSTGVLNDLAGLVGIAKRHGIRVCVDCISSLGATPIDLREVYLASGATGKSLGAYAGLAIVFGNAADLGSVDVSSVPSYLDIPAAIASDGPRYTFPSSTVMALAAALEAYNTAERAECRYAHYAALGVYIRRELRRLGLSPLASEEWAAPVVTTFAPPEGEPAESLVARCKSWGYAIGGHSGYLAERRLVQIATMGAITQDQCAGLFHRLARWLRQREHGGVSSPNLEPVSATA